MDYFQGSVHIILENVITQKNGDFLVKTVCNYPGTFGNSVVLQGAVLVKQVI